MGGDERTKIPAVGPAVPLRVVAAAGMLATFAIYAVWMGYRVKTDPGLVYLAAEGGAEWIRFDDSFDARARAMAPVSRDFRRTFPVQTPPERAELTFRTFRWARVLLDGDAVYEIAPQTGAWRAAHRVDLAPWLSAGTHELRIQVLNDFGPPLALAYCEALELYTDERWEASRDGRNWRPAILARAPARPFEALRFPSPMQGLLRALPALLPLFGLVYFLAWKAERSPAWARYMPSPGTARWGALALWAALGINNALRLPPDAGFDAEAHIEYVAYLLDTGRIPLANEGWQFFQSPLYYLVAAPFFALASAVAGLNGGIVALRLISMAAGAAQIEIGYRVSRLVFPERPGPQIAAIVFAGFLPMNLYISQHPGNEAFAGALSAAAFWLALRLLEAPGNGSHVKSLILLGLALGLAALSKVTAALLAPTVALALWLRSGSPVSKPREWAAVLKAAGIVFGVMALAAGWYYARNWIYLGRPFVGGWDSGRSITWWQDPGYRDAGQLYRFGEALVRPVFSGANSFPNGVYATFWSDAFISGYTSYESRPPWNYPFVFAGILLGLLPTLAMAVGVVRAFRTEEGPAQRGLLLAAVCCAIYGLALFHLFFTVPIYCATKSFYMIGITPCFALLTAAGFEFLTRPRALRPAVYGLFACGAAAAYLAYFSLGTARG